MRKALQTRFFLAVAISQACAPPLMTWANHMKTFLIIDDDAGALKLMDRVMTAPPGQGSPCNQAGVS